MELWQDASIHQILCVGAFCHQCSFQLLVNATESTVRHHCDHITRSSVFTEIVSDLLGGRQEACFDPVSAQLFDQTSRIETFLFGQFFKPVDLCQHDFICLIETFSQIALEELAT